MGCSGTKDEEGIKNQLSILGLEKAIFHLSSKDNKEIGFLCKIPKPNSNSVLPVLITKADFIEKGEEEEEKKINFTLDNSSHTIIINKDRKNFIDPDKFKVAIIEIKEEDNIKTDNIFEMSEKERFDENGFIGVVSGNKEENYFDYYVCKMSKNENENGYFVPYICENKDINESKGNPIINIKTNKIKGIQLDSGFGLLLNDPIQEFWERITIEEEEKGVHLDQNEKGIGILYILPTGNP